MAFIDEIKARAKADKKTIVLPETEDVRTYQAAEAVLREARKRSKRTEPDLISQEL